MGFNKKVLSKAVSELGKAKAPGKLKDIITDPAGQWKYPGQKTRIPGNDITMQGVPYPVWAQPNVGPGSMMQPNQDYNFPGASYVDETPMAKKGGSKLGTINLNPNPLSHYELNYGFNLPAKEDGGEADYEDLELTDEEIQAYRDGGYVVEELPEHEIGGFVQHELVKAQKGGTRKPLEISDPKKYAFRKAAYDDSLYMYKNNLKPLPKSKMQNMVHNVNNKKTNGIAPYRSYEHTITGKNNINNTINGYNGNTYHNTIYQSDSPYYRAYYAANKESLPQNNPIKLDARTDYYAPRAFINPFTDKVTSFFAPGETEKEDAKMDKYAYARYKKPVQPVTLKKDIINQAYSKSKITPSKKDDFIGIPQRKKIESPSTHFEKQKTDDRIIITPLKRIPYAQSVQPKQEIIPAKPYKKPIRYSGPRYGTQAGDENLGLSDDATQEQIAEARRNKSATDFQQKNLEYQEQEKAKINSRLKPASLTENFRQGGALESYQKKGQVKTDQEFNNYEQQKAKYESDKAKGIISSTEYKPEVTVTAKRKPNVNSSYYNNLVNKRGPGKVLSNYKTINKPELTRKQIDAANKKVAINKAKQESFKKSFYPQGNPGYHDYGPQSAGSADWVWTLPILGPAAAEAMGSVSAMSLPGMASVPAATVGNAANAAFIANSLYNTPKNVGDWYDVSQGKKNWKDAALGTAEIAAGLIGTGSGAGFKSVAQDVKQGSKYLNKTLGTETGLLSNTYKYNPWAFKPEPTSAYRMLGKEGLEDAQQSGVFRSNQVDVYDPSFSNKAFEETYYSQGVPFDAKKYKFPQEVIDKTSFAGGKNNRVWNWNKFEGPHMVEVTNSHDIANFNTNGVSPFENFGYEITTPGNAPLSFNHPNVNVYKQHWLQGYKKIPISSTTNAPVRAGLGSMNISKYEIKNPDYYTQLLGTYDSKVLSPTNKKFYKDLIGSVKNQNGLVTERQFNELQRLKSGNFNFGKKAYEDGGATEFWEDDLTDDEINALEKAGYTIEKIK